MRTPPKVLAVCVNWNGREVLPETLASLQASTCPELSVLVVDNASDDGSERLAPQEIVLRLPENGGYAAALNAAVERSRGSGGRQPDYYFFLNNDVTLEADLIQRLVAFAEEKGPGIFGPKICLRENPERIEAAWGEVNWGHVLARYRGKGAVADEPRWNQIRQVELLLGSALLVHRRTLREVGPFDERFFMYHEEVDFLHRARLKGFPVYYWPLGRVFHRSGHATRREPLRKVYWLRRNAVYFLRKHRAGPIRWLRWAATLSLSLFYNAARLRWRRVRAAAAGAWDGLTDPLDRDPSI